MRGAEAMAVASPRDLVRARDLRHRGAVKWGRRRMGRPSVHMEQWELTGRKKGARNGASSFYARGLLVSRGEKKKKRREWGSPGWRAAPGVLDEAGLR
jgi:hypothetical protein